MSNKLKSQEIAGQAIIVISNSKIIICKICIYPESRIFGRNYLYLANKGKNRTIGIE